MATTTNFGWETPDDTDLVKDGALAIRTLGNSIDTSLVDLKGGTTGQVLSKNSNTNMDFTWINNDQGDITEVQAGTGISVASGTGPIPVVTNTVATTFDAKGDLVVGTGADTFSKLTVGTNGHVLTADSTTATGLKWAAGGSSSAMTYITGNTFSSVTSISLPNDTFTSTYENYVITFTISACTSSSDVRIRMRSSGTDATGANYNYATQGSRMSAAGAWVDWQAATTGGVIFNCPDISDTVAGNIYVWQPQKTNKTRCNFQGTSSFSNVLSVLHSSVIHDLTNAYDALTIYSSGGSLTGQYRVYGIANS